MAIKKVALLENVMPEIIPAQRIAESDAAQAQFRKVISELQNSKQMNGRKLAPKVNDFLYASCIMMHAAEASLIDQETGKHLLNASGKPVIGGFKSITDHKGNQSVLWESTDNIKPYKNGNGDIFPEEDLLKAYKEWIGKPLCRDHVSDSIEGVRGVIVDTYYDPKFKRVHALFALDRVNYGELARKIEAGYATSVSMGTAVGKSICTDCGNVATTEAEYCSHVKMRTCYGEVNQELSPIELSIVVTGADPKAKIKTVLAHLKEYENKVHKMAESGQIGRDQATEMESEIEGMLNEIDSIDVDKQPSEEINTEAAKLLGLLGNVGPTSKMFDEAKNEAISFLERYANDLDDLTTGILERFVGVLNHLNLTNEKDELLPLLFERNKIERSRGNKNKESLLEQAAQDGQSVQVGQTEVKHDLVDSDGNSLRSDVDLNNQREWGNGTGDAFFGNEVPQQFASIYVRNIEKTTNDNKVSEINRKIAALVEQLGSLQNDLNKEIPMTFSDLKKKALERKSYFQGTEDPSQNLPYDRMGDDHKIREKEDKQMVGDELDTSADNPDMNNKKLLQRAELEQRIAKRVALLKQIKEGGMTTVKNPQTGEEKVVEKKPDGSLAEYVAAAKDGKAKAKKKKEEEEKAEKEGKAKDKEKADKLKAKEKEKDAKEKDKAKAKGKDKEEEETPKGKKKKAFFQGTEDPSVLPYGLMGNQDSIRDNEDKHMNQNGPLGGDDGLVPGDEALKKGLQRIANKKLSAKLLKSANPADSRWDFFAGVGSSQERVFSVTAGQAYGNKLNNKVADGLTFKDFFHSKPYGAKVMKLVRAEGPMGAAEEMGLTDMPEAELAGGVDMGGASADTDLARVRDAVGQGVEKVEVGLEEIKSAVVEEPASEGLADLEVNLEGGELTGETGLPGPLAYVSDKDMLEAYAFLSDVAGELAYLKMRLSSKDAGEDLVSVAKQALSDAKQTLAKTSSMTAHYKVGRALAKKAMDEEEANCGDGGGLKVMQVDPMDLAGGDMVNDYDHEKEEMYALTEEDKEDVEEIAEEESEDDVSEHEKEMHAADGKDKEEDDGKAKEMVEELGEKLDELKEEVKELSDEHSDLKKTVSSRKQRRQQLIAKAAQYDDVYLGERSGGGPTLDLEGDSKVETLHEIHEAMVDVATKDQGGPRVREAAEKLAKAIKSGAINASKLDELAAMGAVDSETVNYYKSFYGQVDGGAEFAGGLVKEFDKKAAEENSDTKIVRYKRAYMVGMAAQEKGLVARSTAALNDFVDNLVNVPDHVFASIKNLVEQTKSSKTSVAAPQVGLVNDENYGSLRVTASANDTTAPTFENLSRAFLVK